MISVNVYNDMILAMKEQRKTDKDVLSLLYSKIKNKAIETKQSQLDDTESIRIIQKFIKELEDEIALNEKVNRNEVVERLTSQKNFISKYLPTMMSEDEIKSEIEKLTDISIPSVMKHFKTNFQGKVDMSLVNKIAREYQNKEK